MNLFIPQCDWQSWHSVNQLILRHGCRRAEHPQTYYHRVRIMNLQRACTQNVLRWQSSRSASLPPFWQAFIYKPTFFLPKIWAFRKKSLPLHLQTRSTPVSVSKNDGAIAQLVEHRTENPCVPGSNPGGTTKQNANV